MANPAGNYPGRQIFIGALETNEPAFVYFGSGRSKASKRRYAAPFNDADSSIRIKPLDQVEEDLFRHYQAVRIHQPSGLLIVSNSQAPVDAMYELFQFAKEKRQPFSEILGAIGPEYDSEEKPTPRIVGVVNPTDSNLTNAIGIVAHRGNGYNHFFAPVPGTFKWVSTYNGDVDYQAFPPGRIFATTFSSASRTAHELAEELYALSDFRDSQYGELRVWSVAGVRNGNGPGGWEIARRNREEPSK